MTDISPAPTSSRHPRIELFARYRDILLTAWRHRDELAGPKRLADEAAFLPAALSLRDTPVHPAPRRFAFVIIALFTLALAWAIFGKVDIVAVAPGRIIVSERTKVIQPFERSVVKHILVRDGDHVNVGQPLVELDPTGADADKINVEEQLKAAESEAMRSRSVLDALDSPWLSSPQWHPDLNGTIPPYWTAADLKSAKSQLLAEWNDIHASLAKLAAESNRKVAEMATGREQIAKIDITLPMLRRREIDLSALAQKGLISLHASQDKMRERVELERDLATLHARLSETDAALKESETQREAFLTNLGTTLQRRIADADLRTQVAIQERAKADLRTRLSVLTAPIAGVIQQRAINTDGGVVTEAQPLMVIVPDSAQVAAEISLDNKDIGFVNAGQQAAIKLETFPYTRFGTINATVERIAKDAVANEKGVAFFPALLRLDSTTININGKPVNINPGMNVTAEIMTGKRRIIEFLLSPLQQSATESLRER